MPRSSSLVSMPDRQQSVEDTHGGRLVFDDRVRRRRADRWPAGTSRPAATSAGARGAVLHCLPPPHWTGTGRARRRIRVRCPICYQCSAGLRRLPPSGCHHHVGASSWTVRLKWGDQPDTSLPPLRASRSVSRTRRHWLPPSDPPAHPMPCNPSRFSSLHGFGLFLCVRIQHGRSRRLELLAWVPDDPK